MEHPSPKPQLMVNTLIFVESRYKVNRKSIKKQVESLLASHNLLGEVELSIAIVGDRKMRKLSNTYKGDDKTRNILTFPLHEGQSTLIKSDILMLGDIVLSYPVVVKEAAEDNMMVDEKLAELIEHGVQHILGIHHEE